MNKENIKCYVVVSCSMYEGYYFNCSKVFTDRNNAEAYIEHLDIEDSFDIIELDLINKTLTLTELPTEEDITNAAYTDRSVDDWEHEQQVGFEKGALWMKEQILNQNK